MRNIIITGAGDGVGKAVAKMLKIPNFHYILSSNLIKDQDNP